MKYVHVLFFILLALLSLVLIAGISPAVEGATGILHPQFKGMFVSPANIDQAPHTKWLGYLFGCGIISLFGVMLLIGNRKKGKVTSLNPWLLSGIVIYLVVYSLMVFSHWAYTHNEGGAFIFSMPVPTAWMIYVMWFVPLIITIGYIVKFEDAIISEEEIEEFRVFLKDQRTSED